jgi:predicted transcriptional regulator
MHFGPSMKTSSIPPLRVSPELRKRAEAVLEQGETLSSFVLDALTRSIEYRKARQEFIARGLASAARAKKTGKYVSVDRVIEKLARRLLKAKQRVA